MLAKLTRVTNIVYVDIKITSYYEYMQYFKCAKFGLDYIWALEFKVLSEFEHRD